MSTRGAGGRALVPSGRRRWSDSHEPLVNEALDAFQRRQRHRCVWRLGDAPGGSAPRVEYRPAGHGEVQARVRSSQLSTVGRGRVGKDKEYKPRRSGFVGPSNKLNACDATKIQVRRGRRRAARAWRARARRCPDRTRAQHACRAAGGDGRQVGLEHIGGITTQRRKRGACQSGAGYACKIRTRREPCFSRDSEIRSPMPHEIRLPMSMRFRIGFISIFLRK